MIDLSNLDEVARQVGGEVVGGCVIADVNGKKEYITQRNGNSVYATEIGMQVFANMDRIERMRKVVAEAVTEPAAPQSPAEPQTPVESAPDAATLNDLEAALASVGTPGT